MTTRTTLRTGTPAAPNTMRGLRLDASGMLVPWNVHWTMGVPDYGVIDPSKVLKAVNEKRCWTCGEPLRRFKTFQLNAMAAIERVSPQPPSHRDCAEYSATVLKQHRGVTMLWTTTDHMPFAIGLAMLFRMHDPVTASWYRDGQPATRAEVLEAISSASNVLIRDAEKQGAKAVLDLGRRAGQLLMLAPGD